MNSTWDCVVVGGAAGLSAGLVLGRARRRTLIVDAGRQSNLAAHGVGGLLGHDGRPPAELYESGRKEISAYPSVEIRTGEVIDGRADGDAFVLRLGDGETVRARRVLLASGMDYRPPAIPGLAELWGGSVFHCPFCDGWEHRDEPIAVLAGGDRAVHLALMVSGWTDDVVLLTNGTADLGDDGRGLLTAANIRVDERPVAEIIGDNGQLAAVAFADGDRLARKAMFVATTLHHRSPLAERLGVALGEPTPMGDAPVRVDSLGRTSARGVFAAGDVIAQMPQVAAAVATGSTAAAAIVSSLLADERGLPVPKWGDDND